MAQASKTAAPAPRAAFKPYVPASQSEVGSGALFSSGLIAGGSLAGILYAILFGNGVIGDAEAVAGLLPAIHDGTGALVAGGLLFFVLGVILARVGQRKLA